MDPTLLVFLLLLQLVNCGGVQQQIQEQTTQAAADPARPACPPLSKDLLARHAVNNTVLITVVDQLLVETYAWSWIQNVRQAAVSYWFVAALDPQTSLTLGGWGVEQCFNAPPEALVYRGTDTRYAWGSPHWKKTTWSKVHVTQVVYALGFNVLHSDADVTWFQDPMAYFGRFLHGPVHVVFSSDSLETSNEPQDQGLEAGIAPHQNINTGVYFIRTYPGGLKFFDTWLGLQGRGSDQDGLNTLVRGRSPRNATDPDPVLLREKRLIQCALDPDTLVGLAPVSMFGNAYTYATGRVHQRLSHPLYEVHWVWSGKLETKLRAMREAMRYWELPSTASAGDGGGYYLDPPGLVTMDLWVPEAPPGFNELTDDRGEEMVQFHIRAVNAQLRQLYYGLMAALALGRALVMPRLQCFCAKNWHGLKACRINGERHTLFPYDCSFSHVLRAARLQRGLHISAGRVNATVEIKEYSYLQNPSVPLHVRSPAARLVLLPEDPPDSDRMPSDDVRPLAVMSSTLRSKPSGEPELQRDGSSLLRVPWPLDDAKLRELLQHKGQPGGNMGAHGRFPVVHLANASRILARGFRDAELQRAFDAEAARATAYWCCRTGKMQKLLNATRSVTLRMLPEERDPTAADPYAVYGINVPAGT